MTAAPSSRAPPVLVQQRGHRRNLVEHQRDEGPDVGGAHVHLPEAQRRPARESRSARGRSRREKFAMRRPSACIVVTASMYSAALKRRPSCIHSQVTGSTSPGLGSRPRAAARALTISQRFAAGMTRHARLSGSGPKSGRATLDVVTERLAKPGGIVRGGSAIGDGMGSPEKVGVAQRDPQAPGALHRPPRAAAAAVGARHRDRQEPPPRIRVRGARRCHGRCARTQCPVAIPASPSPRSGPTGLRPREGFNPNRPQFEAGMRMLPPPSVAWAIGR